MPLYFRLLYCSLMVGLNFLNTTQFGEAQKNIGNIGPEVSEGSRQRCAWTGFWNFWTWTPAASGCVRLRPDSGFLNKKRIRCQVKFLTSGHLRMPRAIFQIRNFACISVVWVSEIPDHLFRKCSVSITVATKAVY